MKRLEIRLSEPDQTLLNALVRTTTLSRAAVIRRALNLYHFCRVNNITSLTRQDGSTTPLGWK